MVKIYQQPFAHAGTKQVIPDSSDPQGFVSNADGFTSDYELPDTDPNYKPIERSEFNGLMNMVTDAVGELQQFGFAKWQPITWPQGARVVEGGAVYRALNQTSQQPPHADWIVDQPDINSILQPSLTGSITLNGTTDNTVVMTDIVTELGLEVGDVIRIDTGAYNKLHTVESITNNNSIIVNYEHAGNRANGSLKLPDFTGQATVTRIVKWFNAPKELGREWVDVTAFRQLGVEIINSTGRAFDVSAWLMPNQAIGVLIRGYSGGTQVALACNSFNGGPVPDGIAFTAAPNKTYKVDAGNPATLTKQMEYR